MYKKDGIRKIMRDERPNNVGKDITKILTSKIANKSFLNDITITVNQPVIVYIENIYNEITEITLEGRQTFKFGYGIPILEISMRLYNPTSIIIEYTSIHY